MASIRIFFLKKKRVRKHRRGLGLGLQEPTGDGPVKPTCKSANKFIFGDGSWPSLYSQGLQRPRMDSYRTLPIAVLLHYP
jgi:hypothetical protein